MTTLWSQISDKYQSVAPKRVINAIEQAAQKTGANFSFLMEKASAESGFDAQSKSKSSSATGLFQFIDSTWLNMIKEHGGKYGFGALASQIQMKDGKPCVENCAVKKQILDLRKNPEIAALMAGEFSAGNKEYLEKHTGKSAGSTDLYLAHFMGASGAVKFLDSQNANGNALGAKLFPREAAANKGVFFDPATGQPRTLNEIYRFFSQKFDNKTEVAAASPAPVRASDSFSTAEIAKLVSPFSGVNDFSTGQAFPFSRLSAESILMMAQTHMTDVLTGYGRRPV